MASKRITDDLFKLFETSIVITSMGISTHEASVLLGFLKAEREHAELMTECRDQEILKCDRWEEKCKKLQAEIEELKHVS